MLVHTDADTASQMTHDIVYLVIGRAGLLRHLYGDRTCVKHVRCRAALDLGQACYLSHVVHLVCHHDVVTISGNVIFFYPFIGNHRRQTHRMYRVDRLHAGFHHIRVDGIGARVIAVAGWTSACRNSVQFRWLEALLCQICIDSGLS